MHVRHMKLLITTIAAVLLVGCGPSKPPDISIHDAAERGNIKAVKQHLASGADVNAKNEAKGGFTPLHFAAASGYKEVVELLIEKGADVNAKSDGGTTPLFWAWVTKHDEIADLLRKHGGKNMNGGKELK